MPNTIYTAAVVTFNPTAYIVTEGNPANLGLTLSNPSDTEVTVDVVTREGSATSKWILNQSLDITPYTYQVKLLHLPMILK